MKNNAKKIIITTIIILIIAAACFFGGYSFGRSKFDDSRIRKDTELIRQQGNTIEVVETGVERAIVETGIIKEEVQKSTESVEIINSGLEKIKIGLSKDIEGISGVIERLKYYRKKGEVLENGNTN